MKEQHRGKVMPSRSDFEGIQADCKQTKILGFFFVLPVALKRISIKHLISSTGSLNASRLDDGNNLKPWNMGWRG